MSNKRIVAGLIAMGALGWYAGWMHRGMWDRQTAAAVSKADPGDVTIACWLDRNGFRVCGDHEVNGK